MTQLDTEIISRYFIPKHTPDIRLDYLLFIGYILAYQGVAIGEAVEAMHQITNDPTSDPYDEHSLVLKKETRLGVSVYTAYMSLHGEEVEVMKVVLGRALTFHRFDAGAWKQHLESWYNDVRICTVINV